MSCLHKQAQCLVSIPFPQGRKPAPPVRIKSYQTKILPNLIEALHVLIFSSCRDLLDIIKYSLPVFYPRGICIFILWEREIRNWIIFSISNKWELFVSLTP